MDKLGALKMFVVTAQLGSFSREVYVLHGGTGSSGVLLDVLQVVDGGLQTVLGSTQARTDAVDGTDCLVDNGQSILCVGRVGYISLCNGGFLRGCASTKYRSHAGTCQRIAFRRVKRYRTVRNQAISKQRADNFVRIDIIFWTAKRLDIKTLLHNM